MAIKRFVAFVALLLLSIFLIGCSKGTEPEVNKNTIPEEKPVDENPVEPVVIPVQENNKTEAENISSDVVPPESQGTNDTVVVEPETPPSPPEEDDAAQVIDKCAQDLVEECAGHYKFNCFGKADFLPEEKQIIFFAKNMFGSEVVLNDLVSYDEEEPWSCMTRFTVEDVEVSIDGSEAVNINTRPSVRNEGIVKFIIRYSGTDKGYIDQKFALSYTLDKGYEAYFIVTALKN